jgi:3-hydroxyisobutyrate dehydrogenase
MRIGMLGLGRMGTPVAERLLSAGHDVTGWDLDSSRLGTVVAAGSAVEVASAELVLTALPGPREVEAAMGPLLPLLPVDGLWVDVTSNDPRMLEHLASRTRASVVGAGMGGGVRAARDGSIHFFVGGAIPAVDLARPVLETLGRIDHVGTAVGDGMTAKLIANLLWFGQAVAVTEALLLGQSLGIAPARLRDSLSSSAGGSVFLDDYLDHLLDGDYLDGFGIDRCVEELDTLASLASDANVPFELSTLVAQQHRDALGRFGARGGELSAARLLEERAGRTLRR